MSRSGYTDDYDEQRGNLWRGAVEQAINGRRGQAFLKEMLAALDALPEKRLIKNEFELKGAVRHDVCALGAVTKARGTDVSDIDPEDEYECAWLIAKRLGVARALAAEIMFENDEGIAYWRDETPEQRFERMRCWVASQIREGE